MINVTHFLCQHSFIVCNPFTKYMSFIIVVLLHFSYDQRSVSRVVCLTMGKELSFGAPICSLKLGMFNREGITIIINRLTHTWLQSFCYSSWNNMFKYHYNFTFPSVTNPILSACHHQINHQQYKTDIDLSGKIHHIDFLSDLR